jgi:hypothetical protein
MQMSLFLVPNQLQLRPILTNGYTIRLQMRIFIHPDKNRFHRYTEFKSNKEMVKGFGGKTTKALGCGSVTLTDHQGDKHTLKNAIHSPEAENPIISMNKFRKCGFDLIFQEDTDNFSLTSKTHPLQLYGQAVDNILRVNEFHGPYNAFPVVKHRKKRKEIWSWTMRKMKMRRKIMFRPNWTNQKATKNRCWPRFVSITILIED